MRGALFLLLLVLLSPVVTGASLDPVAVVTEYDGLANPSTVTLTAYSDCEDCRFDWDMGDGTVLVGSSVTHTFALRNLWAQHQVELRVCTFSGSICETQPSITVLLIHPAVLVLVAALLLLALFFGRGRIRHRIREVVG